MELLYKVHNNLYANLTNKCPDACTFCLRQTKDGMGDCDSLWLKDGDPTAEMVIAEFDKFDMSQYQEVVFCGFGEPTEAFDVLKEVARFVKDTYHMPIRINTNGAGNLINGRDITPELAGLIDTVSISLNSPHADTYHKLVRSKFGDQSFDAMLDFARRAKQYVPNVVMTTVETTIPKEDEALCAKICDDLGVTYRIRPFE